MNAVCVIGALSILLIFNVLLLITLVRHHIHYVRTFSKRKQSISLPRLSDSLSSTTNLLSRGQQQRTVTLTVIAATFLSIFCECKFFK